MNVIRLIREAIKRGFFTSAEEKANIKSAYAGLEAEDKEVIADDYKKAIALKVKTEDEEGDKDEDEEKEEETKSMLKTLLKSVKDEVISETQSQVKEWLKEQKELAAAGAGVYNKEVKKDRQKTNDYLRSLAKSLLNGDSDADMKLKELSTDSSGSPYGGYVVDSELSAEIRHLMTEYGVARREMTALQLSKNSYKANQLATDITVYWGTEGGSMLSTEMVLGQEELSLVKLYAIVSLTSELIEDSEIDLFGFISGRVAEGFARAEDEAFFIGDGTGTYGSFTGLLNATDGNTVTMTGTTFASVTADDFLDMQDATPQAALRNGKYYMHRSIRNLLRKLKDDQNNYIYQKPAENKPATLWDKPIIEVEAMPVASSTAANKAFVLFGDLKLACILGYKGAMNAKRFDAGTVRNVANNSDLNLITTDREAIRITERVGYIRILPTAVTKLKTAAVSA